jgi:arylsulfatase A-like enzyme
LDNRISILLVVFITMTSCAGRLLDIDKRPNIVLIVADDLGYSDLGCFGSEISTPNIDALAGTGCVFTNFYTAATCSPTRAMLLTGVDHHLAGLGDMAERIPSIPEKMGQPGYEGYLNRSVISIAQLIKDAGYRTYMAGKWHLGLLPDQSPKAKGFEKSFSLLGGYADHFYPDPRYFSFWEDDHYVKYPDGSYSTDLYTDKLLRFIKNDKKGNRPFFMYAAYTAPHWPLQVPVEYIEKYRGVYDIGYDSLRTLRFNGLKERGLIGDNAVLPGLPEVKGNLYDISDRPLVRWDSLDPFEQQIESRKMEIYAGMIDNLDVNIGRLIQGLKDLGKYDNTLFIFFSDNGPAVLDLNEVPDQNNPLADMGTSNSFVAYGPPWAHACSAVNRLYKGYSSEGGIHSPLIIKMPFQTEGAGISTAFATVCDLTPTLLELVGGSYPETYNGHALLPLEGKSMLPLLRGEIDQIHQEDFVTGWELFGRCAIRKGKWKITKIESPFGTDAFELFDLEADPSESQDLSTLYPEKYQELLAHWSNYVLEKGVILINR